MPRSVWAFERRKRGVAMPETEFEVATGARLTPEV